MSINKIQKKLLAAMVLGTALSACSASRLAPDAQGVSFPVREDSYRSEGIVVSRDTVQLLQPGLSKDQSRQLLGNPHFSEGLVGVRDWNYLLRLPASEGGLMECQLQLQFDDANKLRSTHWQTEACAAAGKPMLALGAPAAVVAGAGTSNDAPAVTWSEEGLLFPFGRSAVSDLAAADRARLKALVAKTAQQADSVQRIVVTGHADRIGSGQRKQWRSLDRAHAVAEAFLAKGIAPAVVEVVGRSDTAPLSACPQPPLAACLAPDRRVSVTVYMK
ncbi:MAG TPA: OmpA family protein [Solimonas sp.]|nr:OmpA family protein [Solimonas sp.]